jgi:hypothetical protein
MKIFIECAGDSSVGIPGDHLIIDWEDLAGYCDDGREDIRQQLKSCFSEIFDEPAGVRFEDECPDCGKLMKRTLGVKLFYKCPHCLYGEPFVKERVNGNFN